MSYRSVELEFSRIKIALYSFFSSLFVSLLGQIAVCEFFAIVDFFSIRNLLKTLKSIPDLKKVNAAYLLVFISQVVSDVVNNSEFEDEIRGWANILMAIILVTFLSKYLYKSTNLIILYFIWQIIGMILFNSSDYLFQFTSGAPFKFFWAIILNNLVMIISWYMIKSKHNSRLQVSTLFITYGLFCVFFDYRSNGLFMILCGIFFYKRKMVMNLDFKKIFKVFFVLMLITQMLYSIYVSQLLAGNIVNERSKMQLDRLENPYNMLELIQSGRGETFVAFSAIKDMPIFGHGSWAPDPGGKYNYLLATLHDNTETFTRLDKDIKSYIIPSHSILLGTWMTSGFIGFLGIGYILLLFLKRGFNILNKQSNLTEPFIPIIMFFIISGVWTFLFSPLAHIRQSLPVILALIITVNQKLKIIN